MISRTFISLLLVLHAALLCAQVVKFHKTFGGPGVDEGRSVKQTFDHGYIVAGATSSMGAGGMDVFLIKTDSMGMHQWSRTYGGMNSEWGYSVLQVQDSGFVVAGYTNSYGAGGYDMYLIRTNKNGDTLWTRTYGGINWDFAYSLQQTSDGGYILAGTTASFGMGNDDVYLVKTDANGDTLWTRTYGGAMNDEGRWVEQTVPDMGYILCGWTNSTGAGQYDIYYLKLNSNGDTTWTKTLGGITDEKAYCIKQSGSNYILGGYTSSFGYSGSNDFYLVKTTSTGDTIFTRKMGAWDDERAFALEVSSDGGYVLTGLTAGPGYHDIYLFKHDANGYYFFATTHGGSAIDDAYAVKQAADGGYVIAGTTNSFGTGQNDVYLIKTDNMGATSPYNTIDEIVHSIPSLAVMPNPISSTALFFIPTDIQENYRPVLMITDIEGREVRKYENIQQDVIRLDRGELSAGLYFYTLYSGNDRLPLAAGKLIIQ